MAMAGGGGTIGLSKATGTAAMTRLNIECPRECLPLQDWSASLTTRSGHSLRVRPVRSDDRNQLKQLLQHVSLEDRRFRFPAEAPARLADQIERMILVDHVATEHFVGFRPGSDRIVASSLFTAEADGQTGGVAIMVDRWHKEQGFGWALLAHVARFARSHGYKRIVLIESGHNEGALRVEEDMAFKLTSMPGGKDLVLVEAEL